QPRNEISAGNVGYLISGIKVAREVHVGDTITNAINPGEQLRGYEQVKPMVFAGIYPVETTEFEELRASMEKLQLNDASLVWELETSAALGFGFRCGFLGMLHMEIIQERLEREFNMTVITTVPSVQFQAFLTDDSHQFINAPSEMPDPTRIQRIEEPYIKAQIISKSEYIGPIISLCMDKRGTIKNQHYLTTDRVELSFEMPLSEIVFDFFDKLKSLSRGYASLDYHLIGFRESDMVKLDIMLNGEKVDALSAIVHRGKAQDWGRKLCEKLKELIPRQMFEIAIQAAIGQKIVSRENISAIRKNVIAKCYGGDISRKRKLLEKQKKGKKRMRQVGNVEIPQEAFMAVLKIE
ncbi:MAG TPA: translation elongation factor 4, partial [Chryseolinea sp.]|nr:translation elongation factor 4 [Chryseolinea sp.]